MYEELSDEETLKKEAAEGLLCICIRKKKYIKGSRASSKRQSLGEAPSIEAAGASGGAPRGAPHIPRRRLTFMQESIAELKKAQRQQQQSAVDAVSSGARSNAEEPRYSFLFSNKSKNGA